jgi:integrase
MGWKPNAEGALVWRELSSVIGSCEEYPRKGDIWQDYQDFMAEINAMHLESKPGDPHLSYFVDRIYFESPAVTGLERSTVDGYKDMWRLHLKPLLQNETLSGLRPVTITRILDRLAQEKDLSKRTLAHIKAFLGGIYTFARNRGHFDGANPVQGVKLPKAKAPEETYAYSLKEETAMMTVVKSERALLAIAIASWTGVDKGELEALRWADRIGEDLTLEERFGAASRRNQRPKSARHRSRSFLTSERNSTLSARMRTLPGCA